MEGKGSDGKGKGDLAVNRDRDGMNPDVGSGAIIKTRLASFQTLKFAQICTSATNFR
jgi:hypothetical protein